MFRKTYYRALPDINKQPYWLRALYNQYGQVLDNEIKYCWNSKSVLFPYPSESIQPVSHANRALFRKAFDTWSAVANLTFVESDVKSDSDCQFALFESSIPWSWEKPQSLGSTLPSPSSYSESGISINRFYALFASPNRLFKTIMHEIGHGLWLEHGFHTPNSAIFLPKSEESVIFSIMNYDTPIDPSGLRIVSTTPMPYDIATVQYVYGKNPKTNAGDTVYSLDQLRPSLLQKYWYGEKPITTIWDAGGTDTLRGHGTINLNEGPYELTDGGDYFLVLAYGSEIENVIVGEGENNIVLNSLYNIVDVRRSVKSKIFTSDNGCGKDIIIGFKPKQGDAIIFDAPMRNSTIEASLPMEISIAGEIIKVSAGTQIIFSDKDQLILPGVNPIQPQDYLLVQKEDKLKPPAVIGPQFHLQTDPHTLFHFAKDHFMPTASVSFAVTLSEEILRFLAKKHLSTEMIDHTIALSRFLLSCYLCGGICTPVIALGIDKALQHLTGKSSKPALDALLYIASCLVVNAKPQQIAQSLVKATGYVCGNWAATVTMSCVHSFWKKRKSDQSVHEVKKHVPHL